VRHTAHADPDTLAAYQRSLDRVYERSREVMETAPTWQASLYRVLCACYTEMSADPDALYLHFIATAQDRSVARTRARHRDRLLALLSLTREDAPAPLHAELMLGMIHATLRAQVAAQESPPDLDAAEQTFATLLFHYDMPA
jgi:hypothetical protein